MLGSLTTLKTKATILEAYVALREAFDPMVLAIEENAEREDNDPDKKDEIALVLEQFEELDTKADVRKWASRMYGGLLAIKKANAHDEDGEPGEELTIEDEQEAALVEAVGQEADDFLAQVDQA